MGPGAVGELFHQPQWPFDWREHCGVVGVMTGSGQRAAELALYGLHALQHRGQESAGLAASSGVGAGIRLHKAMGLVSEAFSGGIIEGLKGNVAIGHVRYSTAGSPGITDAQPLVFHYPWGDLALAHNGNVVNAGDLRRTLGMAGSVFQTTVDTEVLGCLLARYSQNDLGDALVKCMIDLQGAYSVVLMTETTLIGMRDPHGFRPLCLGSLPDGGFALASESCALDVIGAGLVREVEPGEIVFIDRAGARSVRGPEAPAHSTCIFEYIYFARPDSIIEGINVNEARYEMGRMLAREHRVEADVVVPVPESGVAAGLGFSRESGIPFEYGLVKNRYLGRTFIQPTQDQRSLGVRLKLNAVRRIVEGKRVLLVDDSIVRGTTSARLVQLLRDAGASRVGLVVASPPVAYPCFYGIDTSRRGDRLAASNGEGFVLSMTGADSLHYLSRDGLLEAVECAASARGHKPGFCLACFDGDYPVPVEPAATAKMGCAPQPGEAGGRATYAAAGVDIDRGTRAVDLIREAVASTFDENVVGGVGGFGGVYRLGQVNAAEGDALLVAGADGVGTKLRVAIEADRHGTIGIDAVAMCVNDVLTCGARPVFFLDYLAQSRIDPMKIAGIVSGIAEGCRRAGCALLGGETAEMPGFYADGDYDVAGFAVGVVQRERFVDGSTIEPGDVLIGLASSGLHSNGFSLARHVLFGIAGLGLHDGPEGLGRPLVEEILEPTRIYARPVLDLASKVQVRGMAHITGGGLVDNPPRMLPPGLAMRLSLGSWPVPAIFRLIQKLGNVDDREMLRTFNMGIGFMIAVRAGDVARALEMLRAAGEGCYVVGEVIPGSGEVTFVGDLWSD
ncbi:MAG: amidophosphoribosyltransferase [Bacillota bacterium]|nr:amidophosphoribosyltransferase [Bacillota bacterium]